MYKPKLTILKRLKYMLRNSINHVSNTSVREIKKNHNNNKISRS